MEYVFSVVRKRLFRSAIIYTLIFIQLLLGMTFLTLALSAKAQVEREMKEFINREEYNRFEISVIANDGDNQEAKLFLKEQEEILKKYFSDNYAVDISINVITFSGKKHMEASEEIYDRYEIHYMSDATEICADEDFIEAIRSSDKGNTVNFDDVVFDVEGSSVVFDNRFAVPYQSGKVSTKVNCHAISVPIEYYYEYGKASSFAVCSISVVTKKMSAEELSKNLGQLRRDLNSNNSEYSYNISSDFYDFIKAGDAFNREIQTLLFVLIPLLIIVFVGITCFFTMLFEKRKFEISICITIGAKREQIMKEVSMELALCSIIPTVFSFIISDLVILSKPVFMGIEINSHNFGVVVGLLLSVVLVNVCTCIIIDRKIRGKNMAGIVYKED